MIRDVVNYLYPHKYSKSKNLGLIRLSRNLILQSKYCCTLVKNAVCGELHMLSQRARMALQCSQSRKKMLLNCVAHSFFTSSFTSIRFAFF